MTRAAYTCAFARLGAPALALLLATSPAHAQVSGLRGDVTGDGLVNALDAQAVLAHIVGLALPSDFLAARGDASGDGDVTALDAQIILAHTVGLNVSQFPVGLPFGPPVATLQITPAAGMVPIDLTLQLTATAADASGAPLADRIVSWSSSDVTRATVSATGLVLGRSPGTVTITATAEGVSTTAAIAVDVLAGITPADSSALVRHLSRIAQELHNPSIDSATAIVARMQYNAGHLSTFFAGYFRHHPLTDLLRHYLFLPTLWWFDPATQSRLQHGVTDALMGTIERVVSSHGAGLNQALAADTVLRNTLLHMHLFLGIAVREPNARDSVPARIRRFYTSQVSSHPDLFHGSSTIAFLNQPHVGSMRRHTQANLVRATARTGLPLAQAASRIGLHGSQSQFFSEHGIVLVDNNYLDAQQHAVLRNYFDLLPAGLHNIGTITVNEAHGLHWWWVDAPTPGKSMSSVDISRTRVQESLFNPFAPDVTPWPVPFFLLRAVLETHRVVDHIGMPAGTAMANRRDALIAAAGNIQANYLRSDLPAGHFAHRDNFLPWHAELWIANSAHTLRLGRIRFDAGRPHPLNQALFLAELYSRGGPFTYAYTTSPQGVITRVVAPVLRDGNGHIRELAIGDSVYSFVRNPAGDVLSYHLRSGSQEPVHTIILPTAASVAQGMTALLTPELRDASGGALHNRLVTWSSSAPQIASVNTTGTLSAHQPGTAVITASSEGVTADVQVTVTGLNLRLDGMYLVQATQRYDGSIPLVAGRPALLRVFGVANQPNAAIPPVDVSIFRNGLLEQTLRIEPQADSVTTSVNESLLTTSWNVVLPAGVMQAGLSIQARIDPDNDVAESDEDDNVFPADARYTPVLINVPTHFARFVPVYTTANGLTGIASPAAADAMFMMTRRLHPVLDIDYDIRSVFTSNRPVNSTDPSAAASAWTGVLSEIEALRVAEGTGRYYYGVVKGNNVGGWAYLPGRSGIGLDVEGDREGYIYAHEIGHNWGRPHAPCGGATGVDAGYPYAGADIGVHGWDWLYDAAIPPTHKDLMSYCGPPWTSDYTWQRIINHRGFSFAAMAAGSVSRDAILVWGRIRPDTMELEPVFAIHAPPKLPSGEGPWSLEGLDAGGNLLFSYRFSGDVLAHAEGERHFTFAIPMSPAEQQALARIRVTGEGRETARTTAAGPAGLTPTADVAGPGFLRLQWNANADPVLMVRDPATREILGFARGGDAVIRTPLREVEIERSSGVRSRTERIRVEPR